VVADWNELDPGAHLNTPDAGDQEFGRAAGFSNSKTKINIDRKFKAKMWGIPVPRWPIKQHHVPDQSEKGGNVTPAHTGVVFTLDYKWNSGVCSTTSASSNVTREPLIP
jgi:hypothetical protein